jgi:hypothetical protein
MRSIRQFSDRLEDRRRFAWRSCRRKFAEKPNITVTVNHAVKAFRAITAWAVVSSRTGESRWKPEVLFSSPFSSDF